jgi:hypothetical protein
MSCARPFRTAFLLVVATAAPLAAAASTDWPYRGKQVTLMLPGSFEPGIEKVFPLTMKTATIARAVTGSTLDGDANWRTAGFPALLDCTCNTDLTKARKRPGHLRVELSCKPDELYWLFANTTEPAEGRALLEELFVPGPPNGAAVEERLRAVAARLVAAAAADPVRSFDYREARYLRVDLGVHDQVFNTIQTKPQERVARVVSERLLSRARLLAAPLRTEPELGGVAFDTRVQFRNFVQPANSEAGETRIELLIPRAALLEFAADGITSQQLIDASVLRVDGNRTSLRLE